MTSRFAARPLRLLAAVPTTLAFLVGLAIPVQQVAANAANMTISETSDATPPVAPGSSFTYTITATANADNLTAVIVADGSLDWPQLVVNSASYSVNGGVGVACGGAGPENVRCSVPDTLSTGDTIVVTAGVTVDPDVNVACDNPSLPGTEDSSLDSSAKVTWTDGDGPDQQQNATALSIALDCTGYGSGTPVPDTTITSGPSGTVTTSSASFAFSGTNSPTSFECKLDAGSFATCTSPKAYSGLANGSHTFSVRGVNGGGTDPSPATRTWTVNVGSTSPFTDIDDSIFKNDIIWLYNEGITGGCTATTFCPDSRVSRDQMASFLVRALGLPATSTDFFDDDDGNLHESNINRLAAAGLTSGCGPRRYCPTAPVNRDQMASFLVRAFKIAPSSVDAFSDDEGNQHENQINALAASGVTGGCAPGRYCPSASVTRGQMAAFLHRAKLS